MENIITISNLTKSFASKKVLCNVDLCVARGEVFGLLGLSGAGKTTLMNILTGQLKKDSGEVLVFGQPIEELKDERCSRIGIVMEQTGLMDKLSCYQNLSLFADIYNVDKSRIEKLLELVNLLDEKKTIVGKLSKGMRQRLSFARAILHNPQILFLDEPTDGLDPLNSVEIHKLILQLKKQGVTIFLTTHKMDEAMKLCEHVAIIRGGTIVEYGTPSEICAKHNKKNIIKILFKDGSQIEVDNIHSFQTKHFSDKEIEAIHSCEPNLEEVFIEIHTDKEKGDT